MALFVLSLCLFDISVGVGAFVIGLSQISSFFSSLIFVRFCSFWNEIALHVIYSKKTKKNIISAHCSDFNFLSGTGFTHIANVHPRFICDVTRKNDKPCGTLFQS